MQTSKRFYLTPQKQIGQFLRVTSSKPELYALKVGEEVVNVRPDFLVEVPEEKLEWFKRIVK